MNHQGTHQTLYILNQNHPGYLSSKDQTRQDQLLRPDQPDHWLWLWIIKNINSESAVFTLSCFNILIWFCSLLQFKGYVYCNLNFISRLRAFPTLSGLYQELHWIPRANNHNMRKWQRTFTFSIKYFLALELSQKLVIEFNWQCIGQKCPSTV